MRSDGNEGTVRRAPRAMIAGLILALAMIGAILVSASEAKAVEPAWQWGSPNYCTHSFSVGVGVFGTKSVTYRSGYWVQSSYSYPYHRHQVTVEYNPVSNGEPNRRYLVAVSCRS